MKGFTFGRKPIDRIDPRQRNGAWAGHRFAPERSGFALMELVMATAVLAIAFAGISTTLATSTSLRKTNQESARGVRAALDVVETMRDCSFDEIYALYNADPLDDPDGPGTAPGPNFAVVGLRAQDDDADGLPGSITFPGDGKQLLETAISRTMGMPRDLNADGGIDGIDHDTDYTLLPVQVRIEWCGAGGNASTEVVSVLTHK